MTTEILFCCENTIIIRFTILTRDKIKRQKHRYWYGIVEFNVPLDTAKTPVDYPSILWQKGQLPCKKACYINRKGSVVEDVA